MNYLKTAASACASILLLFSTTSALAGPPVVESGSALTPTVSQTTGVAADGTPDSGGTAIDKIGSGISSAAGKVADAVGLGGKKTVENVPEGNGGAMGATGCPKAYESVVTVTPAAEKTTGGLDCARAAIGQFADRVVAAGAPAATGVYKVAGATQILALHQEYQTDWASCQGAQSRAATVCIADNSESLSDGITLINGLLSAGGAASIYDTCTSFGKAMDIGQKALAAYTAACTVMRQPCVFYCGDVKAALVKFQAAVKKAAATPNCEPAVPPNDASALTACNLAHSKLKDSMSAVESAVQAELDEGNIKSTGGKLSRCDRKYWQNVASAGVGILQLANSLKQGKKCEDESSALAATAAETCSIATNANLPECICLANPRTAGCSNGLSGVGELNAGSGQIVTGQAVTGDATVGSLGKDSTSGISQAEKLGGGSEGGGIGAPTGGGPSLGSIGGGSGGGVGEKGAGAGGGLNTDILSGAGGGGGGGGYGGYKSGSDAGKGLRSYLPGGAKDPSRGLAGQGVGSKEVTGQAGKSNWEKVRDRYIDNKNSLIGN